MSWELVLWARTVPVDSTARHVLMVVATHATRKGRAWPSMDTLALETGLHRATVYRAVERLEVAGVIDVIHRQGRSCEFLFPQDPHPARSATHPSRSATDLSRSATHKKKEEQIKNAPDTGRSTTWRPSGDTQDAGPVDVRALLAGERDRLARMIGDRDRDR